MKPLWLLLLSLATVSCGGGNTDGVTGTVDFAYIPASFAGLELEVTLADTSLADAPATLIATQRITRISALPVRFSVRYSSDKIKATHRYSVSARVFRMVNGEENLVYLSVANIPVITQGWPNEANIVVEGVARPAG